MKVHHSQTIKITVVELSFIQNKMKVTRAKNCYCHTCKKDFHYLGITNHRRYHKIRNQDCEITFTHGNTRKWNYSKNIKQQ